jgi:mraZ protein
MDAKGRLALPARYRERVQETCSGALVVTLNPRDLCLWIYPLPEWELIDEKLNQLPDFDRQSRRTKQMMRGYALDCELDSQGRILLSQELRSIAGLDRRVVLLGQGNKFEVWDEQRWTRERDEWIADIEGSDGQPAAALESLSF